jgi:hypothetical protein
MDATAKDPTICFQVIFERGGLAVAIGNAADRPIRPATAKFAYVVRDRRMAI